MKTVGWKVIEEIRSVQPQEDQYIPQLIRLTEELEDLGLLHPGICTSESNETEII